MFGLLGPNGAGKTTLVRVFTTLLRPDAGRVDVFGRDVVREPSAVRELIGLTGQSAAVDELLTGQENLEMFGRLFHLPPGEARERASELLDRFELAAAADRPARTYSGGMRRRLDLASSLISRPRMLFLDEPTTGLDPRSRNEIWSTVRGLVHEGTTVLLTTQYLEEADQLADRIAVIDHGRVIAEGTADELKDRVGGQVLEVQLARADERERARSALAAVGCGDPQPAERPDELTMPASRDGVELVTAAAAALRDEGIAASDLALRRPTLDDVFLELTGNPPSEDGIASDPVDAAALKSRANGSPARPPSLGRRSRTPAPCAVPPATPGWSRGETSATSSASRSCSSSRPCSRSCSSCSSPMYSVARSGRRFRRACPTSTSCSPASSFSQCRSGLPRPPLGWRRTSSVGSSTASARCRWRGRQCSPDARWPTSSATY